MYILKFEKFFESVEYLTGLTRKYEEIEDLIFSDEIEKEPKHIQLLSVLAGAVDGNMVQRFYINDDEVLDAVNRESKYTGFEFSKPEFIECCLKLKEEGYLK